MRAPSQGPSLEPQLNCVFQLQEFLERKIKTNPTVAPDDLILPRVVEMYEMRQSDEAILKDLPLVFDTHMYGLGLTNLKKLRNRYGLTKTRKQSHTVETILMQTFIGSVRSSPHQAWNEHAITWPNIATNGFHGGTQLIPEDLSNNYFSKVLMDWFRMNKPELFRSRRWGRLFRRRFWSAGPFDLWCVDQHDKWKKFGLRLHMGLDPFTGVIKWLKIWWTNRKAILICSYYLDVIAVTGFMPLVTQSDPGIENVRLVKAHMFLRQCQDPDLAGTIQH
ncbi:hypothetical protein F5146DRAFT_1130783 [Armillaria mellea]|nr:hypothetical protein F5146DRAFT_1130783 [Armillaria mellea]